MPLAKLGSTFAPKQLTVMRQTIRTHTDPYLPPSNSVAAGAGHKDPRVHLPSEGYGKGSKATRRQAGQEKLSEK